MMYMTLLVCGFEVLCICMNEKEIESFLLQFPCRIIFFTNCTRVDTSLFISCRPQAQNASIILEFGDVNNTFIQM